MSCFVCSPETVGIVAQAVEAALDNEHRAPWIYIGIDKSTWSDCRFTRWDRYHDAEQIYNKLYAENYVAYNARYKEDGGGWPPYSCKTREWTRNDLIELYKRGRCYLYQIAEDGTYNGELYKAVETILDAVASHVMLGLADDQGVEWG